MQVNDAQRIAALLALANHNVPTDTQELLVQGDPMRSIPPHALDAAITAALAHREAEAVQVKVLDDLLSRISVFRDTEPEEDETWESWYFAAFDLLRIEAVALRASLIQGRAAGETCDGTGNEARDSSVDYDLAETVHGEIVRVRRAPNSLKEPLVAPPAQEPVATAETYYTKGKDAEYFENLPDKDFAWAITSASQDLNDSDENVSAWMPVSAMLSSAADRINAVFAGPAVPEGMVQLTLSDAKIIKDALEEFYLKHEMSPEEENSFLTLCNRGNFGRPVRLTAAQEGR